MIGYGVMVVTSEMIVTNCNECGITKCYSNCSRNDRLVDIEIVIGTSF